MPTSGVQVVILNEDRSQVLLIKREDFRVWTIPGGRAEPGETLEETGCREVLEETGYVVAIERFVGEYWRPQLAKGGSLNYCYVGRIIGGDSSHHDEEALAVQWFDLNALPQPIVPFVREILEDARSNFQEPVKRTQLLPLWQSALVQVGLRLRTVRNWLRSRRSRVPPQ